AGNGIFIKPTSGGYSSGFGGRDSPGGIGSSNHKGVDISASKGTTVSAAASGVVSTVTSGCSEGDNSCGGGFGNFIVVTHKDRKSTRLNSSHVSISYAVFCLN